MSYIIKDKKERLKQFLTIFRNLDKKNKSSICKKNSNNNRKISFIIRI